MSEETKVGHGSDGPKALTAADFLKRLDWTRFLFVALIGVSFATAVTLYFFPIYPDEIQVRFSHSRLLYDFPFRSSGFPTCLSTFLLPMPVTMYVPALINWALHGMVGSVVVLRLVGIGVAFLWVAGLTVYLNRRIGNSPGEGRRELNRGRQRLYVAGFMIAMFSVGVFPFFLVANRAEQLMLPSVVLLIAISIVSGHAKFKDHFLKKLGWTALYFTAVSLILFGHTKGLFLTPLFLIVGWQLFRSYKTPLSGVIAMALLAAQIAQAYFFMQQNVQCSESPGFAVVMQKCALNAASLFHNPRYFFDQAYHSMIKFTKYLLELGFRDHTNISYLPALPLGTAAKLANALIKLNISIMFFAMLCFVPFQYFRRDMDKKRFVTVNAALAALLAGMLFSALFSLNKNWYEAGYGYALLLIVTIFFIGENFAWIFQRAFARRFSFYLGMVALLSQGVLIQRNLPEFLKGYEGPGTSIVKYGSGKVCSDLTAAAQACNIDPVDSQRVVVDEDTYLFFRKTKWPMPLTYIGLGFGGEFVSLRQFFSRVDSDGLVIRCSRALEPYARVVEKKGIFCCISKEGLKSM